MGCVDDEQGLIGRSRDGDQEAFASLITRYQRMVHSVTFRMTGSLADADDLAQDTFIQALRHLDGFRGESKFSSWLCRIAVNACLNWRRSRTRRERAHQGLAEHEQIAGTEPEKAMGAEGENAHRVQAALARLPDKQRAAIVLTVFEGMSHAEASRLLGCSETTVSWRLFAARAKLKRLLGNKPA